MDALALQMPRRLAFLILAVALLLAIEPVVHSHPLWENSACAVCAAGVTRLPTAAPSIAAPLVVVSELAAQPASTVSASVAHTLPSRAPPAA
jgi:hypothetical protein